MDVLYSARLTDAWQKLVQRTAQSIDCRKHLAEQGRELSEEEFDQLANSFRYTRDLITSEELEEWLKKRELTVEEWIDHIERELALQVCEQKTDELPTVHRLSCILF